MSLNRAAVAVGAVAVVGAATLGFSIPYAVSQGKPVPSVSVVSGSTWKQVSPDKSCYNGGNALTKAQQTACGKVIQAQLQKGSMPAISVNAAGTFGIQMDKIGADKGWFARSEAATPLVTPTKNEYAGPLSFATLISGSTDPQTGAVPSSAPVLVVEGDGNSTVYGEWLFQLKVKSS